MIDVLSHCTLPPRNRSLLENVLDRLTRRPFRKSAKCFVKVIYFENQYALKICKLTMNEKKPLQLITLVINFPFTYKYLSQKFILLINIMYFRFYHTRMCSVPCVMINIKSYSFCTPKRQDKRDKDNVMCQHLSSLPIYTA